MRRYQLQINGKAFAIDVEELSADTFRVQVDGENIDVRLQSDEDLAQAVITPEIAPSRLPNRAPTPAGLPREVPQVREVRTPEGNGRAPVPAAVPAPAPARRVVGSSNVLTAPMPGTILAVEVAPGAAVTRGQVVAVLEAMKMKNAIKSPRDGVIAEVFVQPNQPVGHSDPLLRFEGD